MLSKVISARHAGRAQAAVFASVPAQSAPLRIRPASTEPEADKELPILRETVRRLESELNSARHEAFEAGRQQGEKKASLELAPVLERMNASVADLIGMRQDIRRRAEKDVVQLSLLIAKRVLHRELSIDANALNALARVIFERLARSESYQVTVHPQFADAIRSALPGSQASRVQIEPDAGVAPGTLRIRSAEGLIDASVDAQLAEISCGLSDHIAKS